MDYDDDDGSDDNDDNDDAVYLYIFISYIL